MSRGFALLLLCGSAVTFAAVWQLTGEPAPAAQPAQTASGPIATPESCEEAEALGVAPLMAGQPGYSEKLDPDGDGLACPPRS
jgi:excalibur calcium-binding domain-containing protein